MSLIDFQEILEGRDIYAYLYIIKMALSSLLSSYYHIERTQLYLSNFPIVSLIFLATNYDMDYLKETLTQLFFGYFISQYLISPW